MFILYEPLYIVSFPVLYLFAHQTSFFSMLQVVTVALCHTSIDGLFYPGNIVYIAIHDKN